MIAVPRMPANLGGSNLDDRRTWFLSCTRLRSEFVGDRLPHRFRPTPRQAARPKAKVGRPRPRQIEFAKLIPTYTIGSTRKLISVLRRPDMRTQRYSQAGQ